MVAYQPIPITGINLITNHKFSLKEISFITAYLANGYNATDAAVSAGYTCKSDSALRRYASELLKRARVREELQAQIEKRENAKIAKPAEILQFYTAVMRGEVLDQFGLDASLDTRLKAANELAKQQIEIPMKLEQKNITNNIGTITLNILPRSQEDREILVENTQNLEEKEIVDTIDTI